MGEIYRGLSYYTNTNARMAQRPGVFICCHPADYKEYVPLIGKPHMHALVIAYQYQIVHKPLEKEGWKKINALCKRMTVKVLFTRTICYLAMCFQPLRIPLGKLVSELLEEGWCLVVE